MQTYRNGSKALTPYSYGERTTETMGKKTDCKQTKEMFPIPNKKVSNNLLKLTRIDLRLMVGLITGHCNLNYHLHKTGATDSPLCRGCMQENETVAHVLLHCEATKGMREATHLLNAQERGVWGRQRPDSESSRTTTKETTLEQLCQRPKAVLRYIKELGWLG